MSSTADQRYIATRIIDACLREDLRGIASRGSAAVPDAELLAQWTDPSPVQGWWRIAHLPGGTLWLPIHRQGVLQDIGACGDSWVVRSNDGVHVERSAHAWLQRLSAELDSETQQLHRAYADEADCAAAHRGLARQAYHAQVPALRNALRHPDAAERAYRCDQLASYRDHPFYPTARAKAGLDAAKLRHYAPEFAPTFALRWLAIPQALAQCTSAPPAALWPQLESLGLPPALATTHLAWPVHPLVWERLEQEGFALPDGVLRAPLPWLDVRPSLSVRTLVPLQHPHLHLKLPIPMRTLGALNLRLIKPSTLYDGHWMERALRHIDAVDPALQGRCVFVDESHGGMSGRRGIWPIWCGVTQRWTMPRWSRSLRYARPCPMAGRWQSILPSALRMATSCAGGASTPSCCLPCICACGCGMALRWKPINKTACWCMPMARPRAC